MLILLSRGVTVAVLLVQLSFAHVVQQAHAEELHVKGRSPHSPQRQSVLQTNGETLTAAYLAQWLSEHSHNGSEPDEYMMTNAQYSLKAREELELAKNVPLDLFLNEVLPYRHLDEPVDQWRPMMFDHLKSVTHGKPTLKAVAGAVIPRCFTGLGKNVTFKANSTPAQLAPISETLAKGFASCTGLSIFVCNCLRSVGVPARVVGTAEWGISTGGNHNWIEAWLGDGWHFLDAAPTDNVQWDDAWFTAGGNVQKAVPGTINGIYTPVWDASNANPANTIYNLTWRTPFAAVPAIDRTDAYRFLTANSSNWHVEWDKYKKASEDNR